MFSERNSSAYDFSENLDTKICYIILSTPRSGSTLLGELLRNTGVAGAPFEYFHDKHCQDYISRWDIRTKAQYVYMLKRYRTSENGVFGFKLHYHQMVSFPLTADELKRWFMTPKFILIKRRDKLRQAISLVRAMQTKQWSLTDGDDNKTAVYDWQAINNSLRQVEEWEVSWQRWIDDNDINVLSVIYEDLIEDIEGALTTVSNYIGIDEGKARAEMPDMKRMADEITEDWVERYILESRIAQR